MNKRMRIGIIMGGFSAERHISVESGRNVYEKLASSERYTPIPIFLTGSPLQHALFILPIYMLLKDSADDIHQKLGNQPLPSNTHRTLAPALQSIVKKYVGNLVQDPIPITYATLSTWVDRVFIALHGRPGEDGTLQAMLESQDLPYNGSGIATSQRTIDKFDTNRFLHANGVKVANQLVIHVEDWQANPEDTVRLVEQKFTYPFISKPVDDGCSVAVVKIQNRAMFRAYANSIFRTDANVNHPAQALGLKPHAPFPMYRRFLVEDLIEKGDATHFLEITGGLLTHLDAAGQRTYEIFKPSEVLATGDVLSLEEKFLAGEGQNITPARFHPEQAMNLAITAQVKADLQRVAMLLNISGYARIDAMVKIYPSHVETWILEVNTLPALTPATCIFHQCAINGYKPVDFIDAIIQYDDRKNS